MLEEQQQEQADCLTWGVPGARFEGQQQHNRQTNLTPRSAHQNFASWPRGFLARYELDEVIGHGASSEVFGARVRATGESVAVKRVFKKRCCVGARATRRLRDEVRVLSKLKHRNVIEMREVWETPTELYIVMERAHGGELFDRIVDRGNFSEIEAKRVMRQLFSALSEMHRRGVIHRDVKPENLLLTSKGGWDIKLSDFGLVKTLEREDEVAVRVQGPSTETTAIKNAQHDAYAAYAAAAVAASDEAAAADPRFEEGGAQNRASKTPMVSPGDATVMLGDDAAARAIMELSSPRHHGAAAHKRPRRPSWGDALETVDEQSAAQFHDGGNAVHDGGGVNYFFSTAGVDVRLDGGPFVAQINGPFDQHPLPQTQHDARHDDGRQISTAASAPLQSGEGDVDQYPHHSYALSEEEAFALLPTLGPLQTPDSTEREVAVLFRRARTHTLCGSPYYMAPEVCDRERYGPAVDVWSAGVVMYILLTGSPPWDRPPQFRSPPPLDMHELSQVSRLGVDLLLQMLKAIPDERCTAAEALRHPWLSSSSADAEQLEQPPLGLSPRFHSAIKNYNEKRKRGASSLDMTPVARALDDAPPHFPTVGHNREPVTVDVKRNRRASPRAAVTGARFHTNDARRDSHEYDTFSSDGSDDDDDEDEFTVDALPPPPAAPPIRDPFLGAARDHHDPVSIHSSKKASTAW